MRALPNGRVLPLRTPVILTAKRRLFVHVWWTSAADHHINAAGFPVSAGIVSVTPGWYEITNYLTTTGSWFSVGIGTAATGLPTSSPALADTFATLGHSPGGLGRIATFLGFDAMTYWMAAVQATIDGAPAFGFYQISDSAIPNDDFEVHDSSDPQPAGHPFYGSRRAWSAKYYVSKFDWFNVEPNVPFSNWIVEGPFILEQGRPPQVEGYDSRGSWTLVPSFGPEGDVAVDGISKEVFLPYDLGNSGEDIDYFRAMYKVVPADEPFLQWGIGNNVSLWILTEYSHIYGVQIPPTPPSSQDLRRIDPWPDAMPESHDYRAVPDSTWGTVYEKLRAGYAELPSEPLPTTRLALPRELLSLDVFVPANASGWVGDVQMTFELAAAGIQESYVGYASLSGLTKGTWSTVTFDLPLQWRQALLGDFPGVRFRTFVNTASSGVRLGGLRFEGAASAAARAPHSARLANVRTTPALDFETTPGWTGPRVEAARLASTGTYSARITSSGWTEFTSPAFSTNSLPAIGTKLSVDVFVPTPSPASHWTGDIQAFLTCQNTSVQNAWIDWTGLQNLFSNEYNTVTLDMPAAIRSALQVPNRVCTIRLTLNTAPTSSAASYYVDRVGFRD